MMSGIFAERTDGFVRLTASIAKCTVEFVNNTGVFTQQTDDFVKRTDKIDECTSRMSRWQKVF